MKRILLLLISFFCFVNLSYGQMISGGISNTLGEGVSDVVVTLTEDTVTYQLTTQADGVYGFVSNPNINGVITVDKPTDNYGILNGVTPFDLALMTIHIIGDNLIDDPYRFMAADINNDGNITNLDILEIKQVMLLIDSVFTGANNWKFVRADHEFDDPLHPTLNPENTTANEFDVANGSMEPNFIGIKTGDVNNSSIPNSFGNGGGEVEVIVDKLFWQLKFFFNLLN